MADLNDSSSLALGGAARFAAIPKTESAWTRQWRDFRCTVQVPSATLRLRSLTSECTLYTPSPAPLLLFSVLLLLLFPSTTDPFPPKTLDHCLRLLL